MKTIFLLLVLSVLSFGCDKNDKNTACPEPQLDCSTTVCLLHNNLLDFRIVDKTTGADLVAGPSPKYSASDVTLYYDAAATMPAPLTYDGSLFRTNLAREEMFLLITGSATYKLKATFRKIECCTSRVKDFWVGNVELCTCCADAIAIPVI